MSRGLRGAPGWATHPLTPLPGSRRNRQPPAPHLPALHQPLARPRALPGLDHPRLGHAGERCGGRVSFPSSFAAGWGWGPPFSRSLPEYGESHIPPAPSLRSPVIGTAVGKGMQWEEGCSGSAGSVSPGSLCPLEWAGRHLLGPLSVLQGAGGCRACGDGPCGNTFGIISR